MKPGEVRSWYAGTRTALATAISRRADHSYKGSIYGRLRILTYCTMLRKRGLTEGTPIDRPVRWGLLTRHRDWA